MSKIVGIDLGTTNSLISVFRDGRPQWISNVHGGTLTPSVVGVLPSGEVIVGSPAKELRVTEPQRCATSFRRLMRQNQSLKLGRHFAERRSPNVHRTILLTAGSRRIAPTGSRKRLL